MSTSLSLRSGAMAVCSIPWTIKFQITWSAISINKFLIRPISMSRTRLVVNRLRLRMPQRLISLALPRSLRTTLLWWIWSPGPLKKFSRLNISSTKSTRHYMADPTNMTLTTNSLQIKLLPSTIVHPNLTETTHKEITDHHLSIKRIKTKVETRTLSLSQEKATSD